VSTKSLSNDKFHYLMKSWLFCVPEKDIGTDHQYSVVRYLVLQFRLRIDNHSFIEKDMSLMREN
jgi:hypothetical protein